MVNVVEMFSFSVISISIFVLIFDEFEFVGELETIFGLGINFLVIVFVVSLYSHDCKKNKNKKSSVGDEDFLFVLKIRRYLEAKHYFKGRLLKFEI